MIKSPHHFETGRLLIKYVFPQVYFDEESFFCESVSNLVCGTRQKHYGKGGERISMHWMFRIGKTLYKVHFWWPWLDCFTLFAGTIQTTYIYRNELRHIRLRFDEFSSRHESFCDYDEITITFSYYQGPLLLTWINFNPSMCKQPHAQ